MRFRGHQSQFKGPSLAVLSDKENPGRNEPTHQSLLCNSVFFVCFFFFFFTFFFSMAPPFAAIGMSKFKDRRGHQNLRGEKFTVYIESHHHQITLIDVIRSEC